MPSAQADTLALPCRVLQAPGDPATWAARLVPGLEAALRSDAPVVIVLCAAGEPLLGAREQLALLDEALRETATRFDARVSRSATQGLAAWAASTTGPLGVDVQAAPATVDEALLDAALSPSERVWLSAEGRTSGDLPEALARLWAGKEAVLKAFGVGLAWPPTVVPVLPVSSAWRKLEVAALGSAWLCHLEPPGAPSIALAVALNAGHARP